MPSRLSSLPRRISVRSDRLVVSVASRDSLVVRAMPRPTLLIIRVRRSAVSVTDVPSLPRPCNVRLTVSRSVFVRLVRLTANREVWSSLLTIPIVVLERPRRCLTTDRTLVADPRACRVSKCILLVIMVNLCFRLLVCVVLTVVPSVSKPARLVTE